MFSSQETQACQNRSPLLLGGHVGPVAVGTLEELVLLEPGRGETNHHQHASQGLLAVPGHLVPDIEGMIKIGPKPVTGGRQPNASFPLPCPS